MCARALSGSVMPHSATAWTVARRAPLFMEFSRQKYWSGLPFPTAGDLPDQGLNSGVLRVMVPTSKSFVRNKRSITYKRLSSFC